MNVKQGIYQNDVCKLSFTEIQTSSKMNLPCFLFVKRSLESFIACSEN